MKYIILAFALLLTGCITPGPVKHAFPEPPKLITETCPDLIKVSESEEKLSEFLKVVTKNYSLYYDCAVKHDLLVKWITEQRNIHDAVFNKGN